MSTEFLNPKTILEKLELRDDMSAADFGSGSGGWVIPLAKILEDGKVYAIDILEEPLSALQARAKLEKLSNIQTITANVENGVDIYEDSLDLVLMTNLLFQVENKKAVFKEAKRIIKPDGQILVVDWNREALMGPKEGRVLPEEIKEIAKGAGFEVKDEFSAGSYHFGIVFVTPL